MFGKEKNNRYSFAVLILLSSFLVCGCMTSKKDFATGKKYLESGDWDQSARYFQKASEENPENTEILLFLKKSRWEASKAHMMNGEEYLKFGKYTEAIKEFQLSISFDPSNAKAARLIHEVKNKKESAHYLKQGNNYLASRKYYQAKEAFRAAVKLDPENTEAAKALSYFKKKEERPPTYRLKLKNRNPISLKFKKTPLFNVFEILTKLTGVNFIFDKDLQESKVTLFMTDVSFDRFIEVLLDTNKLSAKLINENTMLVYPNTPAKAKEYKDLQIRTFYLANMPAKKVVTLLSRLIKSKDITANEKLNTVVVRGTKEAVEIAARIIEANDRAGAEVLLDVEFLEVTQDRKKQLGLQLDGDPPQLTLGIGEESDSVSSDAKMVSTASIYALDNLSSKELMLSVPTATLSLLKQDGDTNLLANPQIRVKSLEKAVIHIGDRIPLRSNRRVDSNGTETYDYEYQDIGVKLEAEPAINMNDEISLKLNIEVSSLGPNIGTVDDPQYSIRTRTAKSVLTVLDGEVVIIGGLVSDTETSSTRKVPFLGEIPGLGKLFSSDDSDDSKKDIIMSITPIVIRSQQIPEADVAEIWSGREKSFSLQEPYESYLEKKQQYRNYPGEDYYIDIQKKNIETPVMPEEGLQEDITEGKLVDEPEVTPPTETSGDAEAAYVNAESSDESPPPVKQAGASEVIKETSRQAVPAAAGRKTSVGNTGTKTVQAGNTAGEPAFDWPKETPYSIQVASYQVKAEAEDRFLTLKEKNYDCFYLPVDIPGKGKWYRVFVGRFKEYATAKKICDGFRTLKVFPEDIIVAERKWSVRDGA